MNKLELKHKEITNFCIANSNDANVKKYSRYFKEGYDGYGIDDKVFKRQIEIWIEQWNDELTIESYLNLGDELMKNGRFDEKHVAINFLKSCREEFSKDTFNRLENWFDYGINNWATTDVLCMLVLCEFVFKDIIQPKDFISWTTSESKWKRRAVPVTFVETYKKGHKPEPILSVIEHLMEDDEEDVQKGLGTLLREIWKKQPELAEEFLLKWKDTCGRKIIQYATEKMDKDSKVKFKRAKNKKQ